MCESIHLPEHVDYVVAIGGLPGGGGRTVARTLQRVFNLDFGIENKDYW